jgi:hypothetical protein
MRAKLSIIAVVLVGGLTGLFFYVARSKVHNKVDAQLQKQLSGNFAAVWNMIESNAHEAVRRSTDISNKHRREFLRSIRAQNALSNTLEAKLQAIEEAKRPDVALVILKGRVLAAYVPKEMLPESKGTVKSVVNRACDIDIADDIFATEVKKKPGAPASALVPAGWKAPPIHVGKLKKGELFAKDLPVAAAAPIVLQLDAKRRPAAKGEPKRLAALVVGWSQSRSQTEAREVALTLAADSELRVTKFWPAYVGMRVSTMRIVMVSEEELRSAGRAPEFLALIDAKGVVLHRNKRTEYLVGESLSSRYLSVNTALSTGSAQSDIWSQEDLRSPEEKKEKQAEEGARSTLLRVGISPIFGDEGQIIGGVCMGWTLSDKMAAQIHKSLGVGVVFLEESKFMASAGVPMVPRSVISKLKKNRVETKTFSKVDGSVEFENLKPRKVTVHGKEYYAAAGILAGAREVGKYSFLIFVPIEEAIAPFAVVPWAILGLGFLCLVLTLVFLTLLGRHFLKPLDEIYNGINEMMAGDLEYTFGVPSPETEGLCYALNGLLAKLLGRPEPEDEEEEVEETADEPAAATVVLGPLPDKALAADDAAVGDLAGEADDAHLKRIFNEYVKALDEDGMEVSGFTFEDFSQKVQVNERMLKDRYECSMVRFKVSRDDEGAPILVPIAIK